MGAGANCTMSYSVDLLPPEIFKNKFYIKPSTATEEVPASDGRGRRRGASSHGSARGGREAGGDHGHAGVMFYIVQHFVN